MIKYLLLVLYFFPYICGAQITSAAVSDSIYSGMQTLVADSSIINDREKTIDYLEAFYYSGDVYVHIGQVAGGQFRAISHTASPTIFKFDDSSLVRAWHFYEINTWFEGFTINYSGYNFTGVSPVTATITVDSVEFTGQASNTEALGMAFYHFLISPNVTDYLSQ